MIYKKILSLLLVVLLLTPMNFAFSTEDDKTEEEKIAELKTNAMELLRETSAMALTLTSSTNRVNFTIKSADILWDLDETDARAMFNVSVEDVRRMITQIDIETNQQNTAVNSVWNGRGAKNNLRNKTSQVFAMRSALVSSLANHDPEWAMRFVQETTQIITNEALIKRFERENKRFEADIIRKIAAKDVTKALELGRKKLAKGISSDVVSLLGQIYGKDKEKGAEFAKDVLKKLKSSTLKKNNSWMLVNLFQFGVGTAENTENPLFDKSGMADLAELLTKQVTDSTSRYRNLSSQVMSGLEKYSPNSASQVKRVFEQRNAARNNKSQITLGSKDINTNNSRKKMWEERSKFQSEIAKDLNSLSNKELSSEERNEIIVQAKNKILSVSDNSYRFNGLIGLAIKVARIGEIESASNILNEAETYINQDPKQKMDFSQNQSLANAYGLVDPDRSFIIMENMIYRLNAVINGYITFMEFSGNGRIVENNELIMNNRSRQFTNYMNFSPQTLKNLAESDYQRLKDLTDKFERSEIRVETRLLIAKALLNAANPQENKKKVEEKQTISELQIFNSRLQNFEDDYNNIEYILTN